MIGRRGEKRFDLLCSDAGVTCNKSVEDDYGWDKLIEFPPRPVPFAAIDMQPGRTIAAVQIKTTTGSARSVAISLSNALHYAKSTIPQFIVLVVLDGGEARYFARHVWAPLITEWLKAGREADARGVTAVNRETVSLSFSAEDERGADLLEWIEREIEAVQRPYASAKQLIVDTVGFEDGYGTARMTFTLDGPDDFLDLQLGLKPKIKASRFVFTSQRFGKRARRPEVDERDVIVHITPEGRACGMRLEFPDGGSVTVPATLYGAADGHLTAFRAASRILDVVFGPRGKLRANASLKADDRVGLEELCAFTHLLSTTAEAGVSLHLDLEGQMFDMGSITMKGPGKGPGWPWMALATDVLRAVAVNASREAPGLTMNELNAASEQLNVLSGLASDRPIRIDFTPVPDMEPRFEGFLAYACAHVGNHVFAAVAHRPAKLDRSKGGRRQLTFGSAKLVWGQVAPAEGWSAEAMQDAYQRQLDRLSGDSQIMAIGDLAEMVQGRRGDGELTSDLPSGRTAPLLRGSRGSRRRGTAGAPRRG